MPIFFLTFVCLTLFAANTIFCRYAIISEGMGPCTYTQIRTLAAIAALALLALPHCPGQNLAQKLKLCLKLINIKATLFLFIYLICFSVGLAKINSGASTLIINASVQISMLGFGLAHSLKLTDHQKFGYVLAFLGLGYLVSSNILIPDTFAAICTSLAGIAWGCYTVVGQKSHAPIQTTFVNFATTLPLILLLSLSSQHEPQITTNALWAAILAGAMASALGYILWYKILPKLSLQLSAIIQLAVPVITAILAAIILHEAITLRLIIAATLILGGIAISLKHDQQKKDTYSKRQKSFF
ncbi:MAG: DMT family transporter [Desulfovibrionaceae bacterium]|nr:DMT family transporter [Desulfovibrionaceae bacterium]